ncbi:MULTISPECIES: type II secretion system F family protein [Anaerostipes]|uniref:Type II secretion system protein GspF domain-containing protein n=1 Tax=Anaerostipes rhamnosivorans TaxID=1229621 RepID=A0A4P8IDS9_9FIRM|nr:MULTISPECIES: type II secretion system F family protein [Anaerostipes]QCP34931.1 hypothetical protein AR1Y2_1477 [Anaerostipes rhamnosivorans]CDC34710.1 uncharacterized protein BN583_03070 [Anaerostipes sp. CAG:276]
MGKKKGKKKKKKISTLQLLNFKNLQTEIYGYGYEYTFTKYVSNLFLYLFAVFCFGKLYQLEIKYILILCAIFFLLLPRVFLSEFKRLHEQKRFDDTVKYMRQLINCYDREPHKILPALKETRKVFQEEEPMYECITKAIQLIETNVDDPDMYQHAFKIIEKEYHCDEIRRLHSYLIRVEEEGGNFHQMLHILLNDTIRWQQRVYKFQKDKQWQRVLAVVMIFVCMILGLAMSIMFMQLRDQINIFKELSYQISQALFLGCYMFIFAKVQRSTDYSWLTVATKGNTEQISRDWELVRHMDKKKERKQAMLKTLISVPFFLAGIFLKNVYLGIAGVGIVYFMLTSPARKLNNAKKRLRKLVEMKFPVWLTNVILSLQGKNLYLSIKESLNKCPFVLKDEVKKMLSEMEEHPKSSLPFDHFANEVTTPEIQTAMGNLYSIGDSGENSDQLAILIENNNQLVDRAENLKNENKVALFGSNMYIPSFVMVMQIGTIMIILCMGFLKMMLKAV